MHSLRIVNCGGLLLVLALRGRCHGTRLRAGPCRSRATPRAARTWALCSSSCSGATASSPRCGSCGRLIKGAFKMGSCGSKVRREPGVWRCVLDDFEGVLWPTPKLVNHHSCPALLAPASQRACAPASAPASAAPNGRNRPLCVHRVGLARANASGFRRLTLPR